MSSLTNGNESYHPLSSNGIEPVLQQPNSSYLPPNSYENQQNHLNNSHKIQNYDSNPFLPPSSSSSNNNSGSTPNLLACLSSSSRGLPPASELLTLRGKVVEDSSRQFGPNGGIGITSQQQQNLPSIASFGQKPPTPSMQQPIPSPCVAPPPSPYLLPPSNYQYQCMTEPGTPAMTFFNPNGIGEQHQHPANYGLQAHSPSFAPSMHGSNPGSIMSAPPESPASASQSGIQRSPSVKSAYSVRMATSTPEYSLETNPSNNFYPIDGSHSNDGYTMSRTTPVQQLHMATTSNACQQQNLAANKASRAYKSPNYQNRGGGRGASKNTMTSILPILSVRTGDDGPTVKEHLQQQQAAQRQKIQQEILSKRLREEDIKEAKSSTDQSLTNSSSSSSSNLAMKPNATFLQPSPRSAFLDQSLQEVLSPPKPAKSGAKRQVSRTNSGSSQPSSNKSRSYVSRVSRLASTIALVASGQSGSFETESGSREVESPPLSDFVHPQGGGNAFSETGTQIQSPHQSSGVDSPAASVGTPPRGVKRSSQAPQRPALKGPRLEEDMEGPPSQCRIHVQNPPNAIDCDFPPTETTIHVVQQPRYQDGRFAGQRSGVYESSSSSNAFRGGEGKPGKAVISVQQHPSVAHIQQQRGVSGYLETRPANYRVMGTGSRSQQRLGGPSPELVHHVIVQSSNQAPGYQPNQVSNVENSYGGGGLSHQLLPASMRAAAPGCAPLNATIPPSQSLVPNARHNNKSSMSRITPAVYAAPGGAMIFSKNSPMAIGNPNVCGGQRNDAQLAAARQKDVEFRKYSIKLYHLQRTIKALVYKNGALSDELARLNQRIYTVTEERKLLAKRLQHHERNRIRRIQTQHRKAAAAARKAVLMNQTPEAEKTPLRANARRQTEAESAAMQPLCVNTAEPEHALLATMKSPSSIASSSGTNYSPRIAQSPHPSFSNTNLLTTVASAAAARTSANSHSSSILSNTDDDLMTAVRSRSDSPGQGRCNNGNSPSQPSDRRSSTSTQNSSFNSTTTQNSQQRPTRQSSRQLQIQQEKIERQQQEERQQQQSAVSTLKTVTSRKSSASPRVSSTGSVAQEQKANSSACSLDHHISPRSRVSRTSSRSSVDPASSAVESNNVSASSKRSMRSKDRSVDKTEASAQPDSILTTTKPVLQQSCQGELVMQEQQDAAQVHPVSAHLRSALPTRRQARRNNGDV